MNMLYGLVEFRRVICLRHIHCSVRCVIPRFPNKEVKIGRHPLTCKYLTACSESVVVGRAAGW